MWNRGVILKAAPAECLRVWQNQADPTSWTDDTLLYLWYGGGGLKLTDDREEGEGLGLFLFLLF